MESTVDTTAGTVEGVARNGYLRFLGIPYAAPPVGDLRFAAPQPVEPWAGVRPAVEFGPHTPQLIGPMEQFLGNGRTIVTDEGGCLTLNIWTPAIDGGERPVMVWIHGGAFTMGSAATPWYNGAPFATDHDVVVVTINYRLGVLGFTDLDAFAGPEVAGSGSLGIQDQAAALRWVRDNIAGFGGDPGNVTIFGESAGGMSVGTLLGVPEAKGLFHKAILQSGAASHTFSAAEATELAGELLEILGVEPTGDVVSALRARPLEDLLEAHRTLATKHQRKGLVSRPAIDGAVLPRPPLDAVAGGDTAGIPLLIGTNVDEWRLFSMMDPKSGSASEEKVLRTIADLMPGDASEIMAIYRRRLGEAAPAEVLTAVMSDTVFRIPAIRLAETQSEAGGGAWMYLFTWPSPQLGGALGSCHALELPFVFNTLKEPGAGFFTGDSPPAQLAADMNATWAAFARYGDPGRGAFGEWPPYDTKSRTTMILDTQHRLEDDPMGDERAAWDAPS